MKFNRRWLLQRTGLALLTLGASEFGVDVFCQRFARWGDRYRRVLAAPTPRKLALLIGINHYPQLPALAGCLTDVEWQQDLLRYRFGFQPADMISLLDDQATHQGIISAFESHLQDNSQEDDVIVFHFSGYGHRALLPPWTDASGNVLSPAIPMNCLVTADQQLLSVTVPSQSQNPQEISASSLWLLAQTLATHQIIGVLDTSFVHLDPVIGHLRSRSSPAETLSITAAELALQKQLHQSPTLSRRTPQLRQQRSPFAPLFFSAAQADQVAVEVPWETTWAGLFTSALTEYLWETTPATVVRVILSGTRYEMLATRGIQQQPEVTVDHSSATLSDYGLSMPMGTAEGVVTQINDSDNIQMRLTGLPAFIAINYGLYSRFLPVPGAEATVADTTVADTTAPNIPPPNTGPGAAVNPANPANQPGIELQIRERTGLTGNCRLLGHDQTAWQDQIVIGQLWQEHIRVLPRQIKLVVALDPDLERIERVDATSALSGIVAIGEMGTLGERAVDCLLSKMPSAAPKSSSGTSQLGGYGLFSVSGRPLSATVDQKNEAVKSAINRLTPTLETLLAAKLWRLSRNEFSSGLGVRVTLERDEEESIPVNQQVTRRAVPALLQPPNKPLPAVIAPASIPADTALRLRIENLSPRPIYYLVLGVDASGKAITWYSPYKVVKRPEDGVTPSQNFPHLLSKNFSQMIETPSWKVTGPSGLAEVHVICSVNPFLNTFALLESDPNWKGSQGKMLKLLNPLAIARAVLSDLHTAGTGATVSNETTSPEAYLLNVQTWATISFYYQVVSIEPSLDAR